MVAVASFFRLRSPGSSPNSPMCSGGPISISCLRRHIPYMPWQSDCFDGSKGSVPEQGHAMAQSSLKPLKTLGVFCQIEGICPARRVVYGAVCDGMVLRGMKGMRNE